MVLTPKWFVNVPTCVIYNPAAGRGRAQKLRQELEARLPPGTEFLPTQRAHHATELAAEAIRKGFERVVAAGGDGTAHEVANGILSTPQTHVRFAVLPVGSMNDYAFTLGMIRWWSEKRTWDELETMLADVGSLRIGSKSLWFINGCGVGFNGMVTVESRKIHWLRGIPLYSLALFRALIRHFHAPMMHLQLDNKNWNLPTLAFSIGLGQREGGFPLTPLARLDDERFDLLHVGDIARWELVRYFPGMLTGDLPIAHPKVRFDTAVTVRVHSEQALCVHADGELVAVPQEARHDLYAELLPGKLKVEVYRPAIYGGTKFDSIRQKRSQQTPSQPQQDVSRGRSD